MVFHKDTIRLIVQFRDFKGRVVVPESVKLTIYDKQQAMVEEITVGIVQDLDKFYYDIVVPEYDFIFEFSGVYGEHPVLARQLVETKFI